jgi:AAA+ superfamily predicted ATPase
MTTASSSPPPILLPNNKENQELSQLLSLLHAFIKTSSKARTTPIRGAVLEGAAGTGKTHLAKEAAQQAGLPYHYLSCICLFGSNRGDAERNLQRAFHGCSRDSKKHVLILDDIEAIGKVYM